MSPPLETDKSMRSSLRKHVKKFSALKTKVVQLQTEEIQGSKV